MVQFFAAGAEANDVGAATGAAGLATAGAMLAGNGLAQMTFSLGENGITAGISAKVCVFEIVRADFKCKTAFNPRSACFDAAADLPPYASPPACLSLRGPCL